MFVHLVSFLELISVISIQRQHPIIDLRPIFRIYIIFLKTPYKLIKCVPKQARLKEINQIQHKNI